MKNIGYLICFILIVIGAYNYLSYPRVLRKVKKADLIGIVKGIKKIKINNISNPINAAIEDYYDKYILSFRINENDSSYIGVTFLDKNLNETGRYKKIDVKSKTAEDARIFKFKDDYFLIYNDRLPIPHICRAIHIAKLNDKSVEIKYKTILDQHIKKIEKNWVPFISGNKLLLAYSLVPHKILGILDPAKNELNHLVFPNNPCFTRFFWKWGDPRGGSPAKLVDGEYLAFFHSCFGRRKSKKFYVMGAYTFQAHPPYKVTKVSKFPIIFGNTKKTRVYFPTGFIVKQEKGKDFIYLSYGENDATSKIAIIDKEKLFEHMKEVY